MKPTKETSQIMNYCFEYDVNGITARFFADGHSEEEAWERTTKPKYKPEYCKDSFVCLTTTK